MDDSDGRCFTVGVFQDIEWASRGLEALLAEGFSADSFSMISRNTPEAEELLRRTFGVDGTKLDIKGIGDVIVHGPLVGALQGLDKDLDRNGVAAHDGYIYETLTARGGVLVSVHSEPRAADALTVLFATGGGNAAIGAWAGRV